MWAVIDEDGHEQGVFDVPERAIILASDLRELYGRDYRVEARCGYGVTRRGEYGPCDARAVGERVDLDVSTRVYPVCAEHFDPTRQPAPAPLPPTTAPAAQQERRDRR